jgi:hypothetical protein
MGHDRATLKPFLHPSRAFELRWALVIARHAGFVSTLVVPWQVMM